MLLFGFGVDLCLLKDFFLSLQHLEVVRVVLENIGLPFDIVVVGLVCVLIFVFGSCHLLFVELGQDDSAEFVRREVDVDEIVMEHPRFVAVLILTVDLQKFGLPVEALIVMLAGNFLREAREYLNVSGVRTLIQTVVDLELEWSGEAVERTGQLCLDHVHSAARAALIKALADALSSSSGALASCQRIHLDRNSASDAPVQQALAARKK